MTPKATSEQYDARFPVGINRTENGEMGEGENFTRRMGLLAVSPAAYEEILQKLWAAGYKHIDPKHIDMKDIILVSEALLPKGTVVPLKP